MLHSHHSVRVHECVCVCVCAHVPSWVCEHLWPAAQLTEASSRPSKQEGICSSKSWQRQRQLVRWTGRDAGARDEISVRQPPIWGFLIVFLCNNTGKLNDMWLQFVKKTWGLLQNQACCSTPTSLPCKCKWLLVVTRRQRRKTAKNKQLIQKKGKHGNTFSYFLSFCLYLILSLEQIMEVSQILKVFQNIFFLLF